MIFESIIAAGISWLFFSTLSDEYCLGEYKSINFVEFKKNLEDELFGQPFVMTDSFLKIFEEYYSQNTEKPLILFFSGGTGTGKLSFCCLDA
jgi:hypothetical protein